ncbi:MAG: DUF935 family protein [Balneola sp.]
MPYVPTELKNRRLPSLTFAKKAMERADETDPKKRDLRDLYACIQRAAEDTRVMGMMITYRDSVLGFDWTIGEDPTDDMNQLLTRRFKDSRLNQNMDLLINTAFTGITVIGPVRENEQESGETRYIMTEHDLTDIGPWESAETGAAFFKETNNKLTATPIDLKRQYLVDLYNPLKGIKKDYAGGLLRAVLWYLLIKNITNQLRVRWMERYSEPDRDATWQPEASDDDIEAAKEWAKSPGDNSNFAHSDKVKASFLEVTQNPSKEAFQAAIDDCNTEMAILILGQTASTEGTPGKLGNEEERSEIRKDRMWSALKRLERVINDQFLEVEYQIEQANSSAVLPEEYKFRFLTESQEDYETNSRSAYNLHQMGADLEIDTLEKKTGLKIRKTDDGFLPGNTGFPGGV